MRFNDVFSKMRESRRPKTIRFHDLMPLIFSDDTKDKNGALHSGKNGQFVSKGGDGGASGSAKTEEKTPEVETKRKEQAKEDPIDKAAEETKNEKVPEPDPPDYIKGNPKFVGMNPYRISESNYFEKLRNSPLDKARAQKASDFGIELLNHGVNPERAVFLAYREVQGYVDTTLPKIQKARVLINKDLYAETGRNFHPERLRRHDFPPLTHKEKRGIAVSMLLALAKIYDVIRVGTRRRWGTPTSYKHVGEQAITISGWFEIGGERKRMAVDLLKKDLNNETRVHNVNVEGTKTFAMKGIDEEEVEEFEVAGIRFI